MTKDNVNKTSGDTKEFISPSGYSFVLREQNGEDDDILSNGKGVSDGSSSANFISAIVIKTDYTKSGQLTPEDAKELKLVDKYFIIIASRIFSIGQILKYGYEWPDLPKATEYEEDLGLFIWDYGNKENPFPGEDHEEYFRFRLKPHLYGKETSLEIVLSTQKVIRFDFMNSKGEAYQMGLKEEEVNKNSELKARNIHLKMGTDYVKIESFRNFTPREMMEIRNKVFEADPILELLSEIEHPMTGQKQFLPILGTPDFFYPREV